MGFVPKKSPQIDYGKVEIKKLPAGKAFGADDLTRWALRRTDGRSGMGADDTVMVKLTCKKCFNKFTVFGRRKKNQAPRGDFACRKCGSKNTEVGKVKVASHAGH